MYAWSGKFYAYLFEESSNQHQQLQYCQHLVSPFFDQYYNEGDLGFHYIPYSEHL